MSFPQTLPASDNGYAWYQCSCCPYGYHIDLDFVRYCESIGQVERSGSIKRRKDRRRQRQSMEVLLGLAPIISAQNEPLLPPIKDLPKSLLIQDALDDVVSDFERTLQRSKNKLSNNLPDVTAVSAGSLRRVPSVSSMSSTGTSSSSMTILRSSGDVPGGRDFDTVSIESCGLSPAALQNIREQMALSLERTKELEELVKTLPSLQAQLTSLKEENMQLLLQLQAEEESKLNRINSNYLLNQYSYARNSSNSFSDDDVNKKQPPPPPPRRDFGVMAGVLTRNIGVGHQTPHTKSTATATQPDIHHVDRWYDEKAKFLNGDNYSNVNKVLVPKGTQTTMINSKRNISIQTNIAPNRPTITDIAVQTRDAPKLVPASINAVVETSNAYTQYLINTTSIGTSEDTINNINCPKCSITKRTLGVGTSDIFKEPDTPQSISLAALSVPRSKSFHLGEEKLNITHSRTVASQYENCISHKSSQSEIKTSTKYCQHELSFLNKSVQYDIAGEAKGTDTKDLGPVMKHKSCECVETKPRSAEVATNTSKEARCSKCNQEAEERREDKKDEAVTPSRIPRPQIPTTPVENRKFRRQDTYTKIPSAEKSLTGLSALELVSPKAITGEVSSPIENVKQKFKLNEVPKHPPNGTGSTSPEEIQIIEDKKIQATVSENTLCRPPSPRKKCPPSKEMQGAMKVLNDSLQKNHGRDLRGHLKNANAIVETEWFNISSTLQAAPVDVEDYLDCFEDISSVLLEYIVNMVDASGNTAMHYAVSHGNFDVVSILLDSKVCDINKQNKAGYTSVMLVSLAEIKSQTHANVVRRLFSLADVNIRAKQHGQTALMLAVSHGRLDMVSMLLDAGADINIQDEDGSTALMCAAEHGHVDIVKHFLSQPDCDSGIIDVDGSTALKIAMEAGHRHIGVLLYAHERNLHGNTQVKPKKSKSTSASPKTPSSPLMQRSVNRALPANK